MAKTNANDCNTNMSANPDIAERLSDLKFVRHLSDTKTDKSAPGITAPTVNRDILEKIKILNNFGCDVSPEKDRGILKIVNVQGWGSSKPLHGDDVYMEYRRWLTDGAAVDDGYKQFKFQLGESKVIPLCEYGVPGMLEGETSMFLCKPSYAFTSEELSDPTHKSVDMIFEIRLLYWHGQDVSDDGDGSIYKSCIEAGESYGGPNEGAKCTVEIVGRCKDKIFDQRRLTFNHGEGLEHGIVEGVEQALLRFSRGEKARLKLKSRVAYGKTGSEELGIPSNADLEYDVCLIDCVRTKDFWDMTAGEKLEQSKQDKLKGLQYFQEGKYKMAIKFFQKVIEYFHYEDLTQGLDKESKKALLLSAYLNSAICHLKCDQPFLAASACSKAIEIDPTNEKAYFRRGLAFTGMKNYKEALEDFKKVTQLNPENKGAKTKLKVAEKSFNDVEKVEKERLRKMFS